MRTPSPSRSRNRAGSLLALTAGLGLVAACAAPGTNSGETATTPASDEAVDPAERPTSEIGASAPRLAITHEGGVTVLDATTLEPVGDVALAGFLRLNPAGDERHAFVTTSAGFELLDLGSWGEPHGDHAHYYSTDPALLDVVFPAETPGHVVVHEGRTVLFDDGTGAISAFDSADVASPDVELTEYATTEAHHGVAVELTDGSLFVTEGNEESRNGVRVLGPDGAELAASDECPGVHGETVAEHEAVVVGCEDGALFWHKGELVKVASPDDFGRIGNLRGSDDSDIVLGDYGTNPEGGDLTQVALIDIHDESISLVDLGVEYTFRSLALDDDGHALVLAADGAIHVIDPASGEIERTIDVIDPWEVPEDWQQPRPTLTMLDGSAYVTDPATQRVLAVDIETGEIWREGVLSVTPNEITGVTGDVPEHGDDDHGTDDHGTDDHGDEEHGDEDHDH